MTASATTIEDKIAEIMLADSALDDLKLVIRGVPYSVPTQYCPYALVVIATEEVVGKLTGGKREKAYTGVIQVNIPHNQDFLVVVDRTARIASYAQVHELIAAIVALFSKTANQQLGNLAVTGGAVREILIGDDLVVYGERTEADEESPRVNTFNFGEVPFVVRTMESAG